MNEFSAIVEVPAKQSSVSQGPCLGRRRRRCVVVNVFGDSLLIATI